MPTLSVWFLSFEQCKHPCNYRHAKDAECLPQLLPQTAADLLPVRVVVLLLE